MKCYIVRDLLPGYIDGMVSGETAAEVQAHITQCTDCRAIYEKMTAGLTHGERSENTTEADVDFLKRLKARMLKKNFAVAVCTGLAVVGVLAAAVFFLTVFEIAIPFDEENMWVEVRQSAVVIEGEYVGGMAAVPGWAGAAAATYSFRWRELLPGDELEEGEEIRDELVLRTRAFAHRSINVYGRNLYRDGERVRLVFYNHTEEPLRRILRTAANWDSRTDGRFGHAALQGGYYGPQQVEVYYLPNLHRLLESTEKGHAARHIALPDDALLRLINDSTLVWSGVVGREAG